MVARELQRGRWGERSAVIHFELFCDPDRERWSAFAVDDGFVPNDGGAVVRFSREGLARIRPSPVRELSMPFYAAFHALHDEIFPRAYYKGHEILARLCGERKVFVFAHGADVHGYIYAEAQPILGEGSVEFIGVAEQARGQQLGVDLLAAALRWLFTFDSIGALNMRTTKGSPALALERRVRAMQAQRSTSPNAQNRPI